MNKIIQTRWKITNKITVLVSYIYSVPYNGWRLRLLIIKTHHLKVDLCKRIAGLVELKFWALENKKKSEKS